MQIIAVIAEFDLKSYFLFIVDNLLFFIVFYSSLELHENYIVFS